MGDVTGLIDEMFQDEERYGATYAAMLVVAGEVVTERYGNALPHWEGEPTPVVRSTPLLSWSMAKSILHAAVGVLVGQGRVDVHAPAPVAAWQGADDPRREITVDHLLAMRDGLDFVEDYVDGERSDVIQMLFGSGTDDVAAFAIDRPLAHPPGSTFNYSSGTSNIVAKIVTDALGGTEDAMRRFLTKAIFEPLGMVTADPRFDATGTWIASSYVYATARDFARFGELYLADGVWAGRRILPEGWVSYGTAPFSVDASDGREYGHHWWARPELGTFSANGHEGQSIVVAPDVGAVLVRLGRSTDDHSQALRDWHAQVVGELR